MAHTLPKARRFHVKAKDREYFATNMALLLRAAVPVGESFESLKQTSKSKRLRRAIDQIMHDIDEGTPLWKSLERAGIVTPQTLTLIRLGEQSGKLAQNLQVAAKQEEKQHAFRAKVRSALVYPTFVIGLTLIVGLGVAWFLLPRLAATFEQLDIDLPFISQVFISFGLFLQRDGWWAVPAGILGGSLLMYLLFAAPKTRQIGFRLLFYVPGISKLLHEVEIARFGYLLGTLLEAGLNVTEAFLLLQDTTQAVKYQKLYKHLKEALENGYSFKGALGSYKHAGALLPAAVQQMIIAGERSGALPETLQSVGAIYEQKADTTTQNLESILEPILLVVVWLGVLGVAVAVILPVYSLIGGLGE